jgi:quercetin dioxygenase-like cupin family protein
VRYHNPSENGKGTVYKFHSKEPDIPWRTLMPGVYIKTLRHVENKFAIHMLKVEAGFTEAPETHDADQYAYVLRGKAESHIGDEKVVIGPGDTFEIPANTKHSVRVLEGVELVAMITPPRKELV